MIKNKIYLTVCLLWFVSVCAANVSVKLSNESKGFSLFRSDTKLLELEALAFDFIEPDSVKVVSQSNDEIVLQLFFTWINPDGTEETIQQSTDLIIDIKPDFVRLHAHPKWANYLQLTLKDLGGAYYGLQQTLYPANKKTPNLRNATIDVEVNGEAYRYHENYASVYSAFYYNSNGYASFFDTFASGRYNLSQAGKTVITHNTGKLDWYLFTGEYKTIYTNYYSVIGRPKYVPEWACGPIIWRDDNSGSDEILEDVKKFTQLKIPFTSIFVDRPYSNGTHGWSKMDFSSEFANPDKWISTLNDHYGVEFMSWITPATFGDQDFPGLLAGHFGYFDLTNSEAVSEFNRRLDLNQYKFGVKGHKLDRADEHFPVSEKWADNTDIYQRRNKYPYLYARVTDSLLNKAWGLDNVNFARAAFHRSQPYLTAVWGGDVRTCWDGLASNIANAMRCSFMGFPNWGSDVGGYLGEGYISEDLYARWLQFGVWTGFYEVKLDGAGGSGQERTPWQYPEEFQKLYADIFSERMEILPYVYSMLNSAAESGPLMKPMAMVYPSDKRYVDCWDQYMFGDAFLVAPIYSKSTARNVILPEGDWYDYYTKKKYDGNKIVNVNKPINEFPVFIKAGSLFCKGQIISGNSKRWQTVKNKVNLYFVPGESCEFVLIDPSTQLKVYISAEKISNREYTLKIPENALFNQLRIICDTDINSADKNGKRIRVKKDKNSSEYYFENISGSELSILFE